MFAQRKSNEFLILVLALTSLSLACLLQTKFEKPVVEITKQQSAVNVNATFLRFMSLGNKRLLADLLWIKTLIESDNEHYSKKDFNNWMYLRFLTISELDPLFYENYLYGGLYLSIVKDDVEGAADIYDRGLKMYPQDYQLHFNAGFNYYFEMSDIEKGLPLLEKIQDNPKTPKNIKSIINKLRFESNRDYQAAFEFLTYSLENTNDPILIKKLRADLYSLTAERDIECLNQNKPDCKRVDYEGNAYLYREGKWIAPKVFLPYKVHRHQN